MKLQIVDDVDFWKMREENPSIPVILWGIGSYYSTLRKYIKQYLCADYIHDKKWENSEITTFDGYEVLSLKEMKNIGNCIIICCLRGGGMEEELIREAYEYAPGALLYCLRDIFPIARNLSKEEIIRNARPYQSVKSIYRDFLGNCIEYETPVSLDNVKIQFVGVNAKIKFGREVWTEKQCNIRCGNNASVTIGEQTTFIEATLNSAWGDIVIGKDCMISYGVFMRNHDSHFIFDAETGDRINYSRTIDIKDHVWIGQDTTLLGGFSIGRDSILGAGSVSSSVFPEKVIVAGNPAKVIREGVIWHRNKTWTENYDNINEIK